MIGEINMYETMETKYYKYDFHYDGVWIKNIVSVESKIIHLPLCFLWLFQFFLKNKGDHFKQPVGEILIMWYEIMKRKQNILSLSFTGQ